MGAAAARRVRDEFTVAQMIAKTTALYRDVLAEFESSDLADAERRTA
jgi:hypothetical protein